MLGYDPFKDMNRYNPDVHYRLYWSNRTQSLVVICVQDFDYHDYYDDHFVDYVGHATEVDANRALVLFKHDLARLAASLTATP